MVENVQNLRQHFKNRCEAFRNNGENFSMLLEIQRFEHFSNNFHFFVKVLAQVESALTRIPSDDYAGFGRIGSRESGER